MTTLSGVATIVVAMPAAGRAPLLPPPRLALPAKAAGAAGAVNGATKASDTGVSWWCREGAKRSSVSDGAAGCQNAASRVEEDRLSWVHGRE